MELQSPFTEDNRGDTDHVMDASPKALPLLAPPSYIETTQTSEPLPITRINADEIDLNDPRLCIHSGPDDDVDVETGPSVEVKAAPDGGWGWLIVLASFFINMVLDGIAYSCGVYFPVFMEQFEESASKTAWIGSLCSGCYLAVSPIAGAVTNRFGCRKVSIFGCLWAGVSLAASAFATSLDVLIVTWGISTGLAFGFLYLPSIVIVGLWFEEKRGIATGITVAGTGLGLFVFPPLCTLMIDRWGWRHSLFGLSALIFSCAPLAFLYRDVPPTYRNGQKVKYESGEKKKVALTKEPMKNEVVIVYTDVDMEPPEEELNENPASSRSSLDAVAKDDMHGYALESKQEHTHSSSPDVTKSTNSIYKSNGSHKTKNNSLLKRAILNKHGKSFAQSMGAVNSPSGQDCELNVKSSEQNTKERHSMDCLSENLPLRIPDSKKVPSETRRELASTSQRVLDGPSDEPLRRKDLFYSGSTLNLAEDIASRVGQYKDELPTNDKRPIELSEPQLHDKLHRNKFVSGLLRMLGFEVFSHKCFVLLLITTVFAFAGFYTPFIYITDYASINGFDTNSASFLISITGIANTIGRPLVGLLVSIKWADSVVLLNCSLISAGILTVILPFLTSYWSLALYAALFGISAAAQICVRSLAIVQLMGVERLTSAFGFCLLFTGVATMVGVPINGLFYDEETQSYTTCFLLAGVFMILGGVLGLPMQRLSNWERIRHPDKYGYVVDVDKVAGATESGKDNKQAKDSKDGDPLSQA